MTGVVGHPPPPAQDMRYVTRKRKEGEGDLDTGTPRGLFAPFESGEIRAEEKESYPSRGWLRNVLHSHNRGGGPVDPRRVEKSPTTTRKVVFTTRAPRHRSRLTISVASKCGALADEIKLDCPLLPSPSFIIE